MISSAIANDFNQDCLIHIFDSFNLKQLCILEQVCSLWEKTAKNHSSWIRFAAKHCILVGEKPFKNHVILNRIYYCAHVIKVLNFQMPCMSVTQFQKEVEARSTPSSMTVVAMCHHIEHTFPEGDPKTQFLKILDLFLRGLQKSHWLR